MLAIPRARLVILQGVSHFAMLPDPGQFNDALDRRSLRLSRRHIIAAKAAINVLRRAGGTAGPSQVRREPSIKTPISVGRQINDRSRRHSSKSLYWNPPSF